MTRRPSSLSGDANSPKVDQLFYEEYEFPASPANLVDIEQIVAKADLFTPSFEPERPQDLYSVLCYRREAVHNDTDTVVLADRNLVGRWASVIQKQPAGSEHRIAAAVMSFAQCANLIVEPSLALYEGAAHHGSEQANKELALFRTADNVPATEWISLALGTSDFISDEGIAHGASNAKSSPTAIDFEMPLRRWRRNYILALKLADLELLGGSAHKRFSSLIEWMYSDFLMGGPAVILAAYYLAPNANREGLIHNLRSPDRGKALKGVRNAAWDLTLLSDWLRHAAEQTSRNRLALLASRDRGIHLIARALIDHADPETSEESFALFEGLWGKEKGLTLAKQLRDYQANAGDPERQLNRDASPTFIDNLIAEGEERILLWSSKNPR